MAETPVRKVRVSNARWQGAHETLLGLRDRLYVPVRVEPGMTRSDVIDELMRVLAEDVPPVRALTLVLPEDGDRSEDSTAHGELART